MEVTRTNTILYCVAWEETVDFYKKRVGLDVSYESDWFVEFQVGSSFLSIADAAEADPDTVCGLHLGLAQGLADQLEEVAVDDLIRRNPVRAGCRIRFHLTPLASETTSS